MLAAYSPYLKFDLASFNLTELKTPENKTGLTWYLTRAVWSIGEAKEETAVQTFSWGVRLRAVSQHVCVNRAGGDHKEQQVIVARTAGDAIVGTNWSHLLLCWSSDVTPV